MSVMASSFSITLGNQTKYFGAPPAGTPADAVERAVASQFCLAFGSFGIRSRGGDDVGTAGYFHAGLQGHWDILQIPVLSARDAAGVGAAGAGAADNEDAPGDSVAQRVAALEVETARLARLAHLARLSRWDKGLDSKYSDELHRSAGPNTRFASRYGDPSGTSLFDPANVTGWGGGPEGDFIIVQVAGAKSGHRVPLPAQWQHASFCIRELKIHLEKLLGIGVSPIGTSLFVHVQSGATFQATSGLTLPQAFIRRGSKVTLNKTSTPAATLRASTSSSESPGS